MRHITEQIDAFLRQAGNLTVPDEPVMPPPKQRRLALDLLTEEVEETQAAAHTGDAHGYLDGLGDVLFVTLAAIRNCGVCPEVLINEICRSNLTKFRPGHSWREDGKLLKSPVFEPPDLRRVIEESKK